MLDFLKLIFCGLVILCFSACATVGTGSSDTENEVVTGIPDNMSEPPRAVLPSANEGPNQKQVVKSASVGNIERRTNSIVNNEPCNPLVGNCSVTPKPCNPLFGCTQSAIRSSADKKGIERILDITAGNAIRTIALGINTLTGKSEEPSDDE